MSCICTSQQYIDQNGNIQNITEGMCVEIIADNPDCCDVFDFACYKKLYFDTTAFNYVGCKFCQSTNPSCCEQIQNFTNSLNPDKNSNCCENFDSYCVKAKNILEKERTSACFVEEENTVDNTYSSFLGIDLPDPPKTIPDGSVIITCPGDPLCISVGLICDSCAADGSFQVLQYQCGCPGQEETRYACIKVCVTPPDLETGEDGSCLSCDFVLDPVDQLGCQPCTFSRPCPSECDTPAPPPGCLCLGCDLNYGYTSYTSTPEVFLAVWSPPWVVQQDPDNPNIPPACEGFCTDKFGTCGTIDKETYPCEYSQDPQPCSGSMGTTLCACYDKGGNWAAFTRFSARKFKYNESGVQNTSIRATDEEQIRYRENEIATQVNILQGNCRKCCDPSFCGNNAPPEFESVNTACVHKQMDPYVYPNNCYGMTPNGDFIDDQPQETAIAIIKNIQAGIKSKYLGCIDCPQGDESEYGTYTPGVRLLESEFCSYEQPITECKNQNYVYGKPLPEGGITGVFAIFDAPHKYELFSSDCCKLITKCAPLDAECLSQYGSNCDGFMNELCETRAFRFCIHDGCDLLDPSERSSEPFVHYYQGISAGDDYLDGSGTNDDCFGITSMVTGLSFIDDFGDRTTINDDGQRSSLPPQKTGTCFNNSAPSQFNCIKLMADISSPGNPRRDAVVNYFKNYMHFDISSYLDECFCSHMDVVSFDEGDQPAIPRYPYDNPGGVNSPTPKLCKKWFEIEQINKSRRENVLPGEVYTGPFISNQGEVSFGDLSRDYGYLDATQNDYVTYAISEGFGNYFTAESVLFNAAATNDNVTNELNNPNANRNPCTPCHGFYPLYLDSIYRGFTAENLFLNLQGYSKYKFYGDIDDGAYKTILTRKTLLEQIATNRIYNKEACEFIQAVICSGIEVLHITEPSDLQFYNNTNYTGLTGPANREILSKIYGSGIFTDKPLESPSYLSSYGVGSNPIDTYAVKVIETNNAFNINLGVCRSYPSSPEDNFPFCNVSALDAGGNIDACNNVNEIIMAGRCYSGPILSKEIWYGSGPWMGFANYFENLYGYTAANDKTFKEWILGVTNLNQEIPNTGQTVRSLFYGALRTGENFLRESTPNTDRIKIDEARYLDPSGTIENPYIPLEKLKAQVVNEHCFDSPILPTFVNINKPCLSDHDDGACAFFGSCDDLETFLLNVVSQTPCPACESAIDFCGLYSKGSTCANQVSASININNNISSSCVTSDYILQLFKDICDAESNPCSFKYNNKRYRQKPPP